MVGLIAEKELSELKSIRGEFRGVSLENTFQFILRKEGPEGVEKIEKALADLGYNVKAKDIVTMQFYPLPLWAVFLVLIQKIFNYGLKDFQELGKANAKFSFIIRLFAKYFVTPRKIIEVAPDIWRKYYTVGQLEVVEYNDEKRRAIVRLKNFLVHPILCQELTGYFPVVVQMANKQETVCKEVKCMHEGDDYHEFLLNW